MPGGNPSMFRARYDDDAELLVRERAARRRRPRSRRQLAVVTALVTVLFVVWGLYELLA